MKGGKFMKKFGVIAFLAVVMFGLSTNVSAMTKSELQAKFTATYTVNGKEISLRDTEKVLVEEYLAKNDVTSTDADYIASKIDEALTIMRNANVSDIKSLPSSAKKQLVDLVTDISNNTAVKATVLSGGILSIQNLDGTEFAKVTKDAIKQTGSNNIILITGVISLVGIAIAVGMLKKKNA